MLTQSSEKHAKKNSCFGNGIRLHVRIWRTCWLLWNGYCRSSTDAVSGRCSYDIVSWQHALWYWHSQVETSTQHMQQMEQALYDLRLLFDCQFSIVIGSLTGLVQVIVSTMSIVHLFEKNLQLHINFGLLQTSTSLRDVFHLRGYSINECFSGLSYNWVSCNILTLNAGVAAMACECRVRGVRRTKNMGSDTYWNCRPRKHVRWSTQQWYRQASISSILHIVDLVNTVVATIFTVVMEFIVAKRNRCMVVVIVSGHEIMGMWRSDSWAIGIPFVNEVE